MSTPVSLIYARSLNGVIGDAGDLPKWKIPGDLKRFKELTLGGVVIMGRKTWESLPAKSRPLTGRVNFIISSQAPCVEDQDKDVTFFTSPDTALQEAYKLDRPIWIIGGASVYKLFEDQVDFVYETLVLSNSVCGDTRYVFNKKSYLRKEEIVENVLVYRPDEQQPLTARAVHRFFSVIK